MKKVTVLLAFLYFALNANAQFVGISEDFSTAGGIAGTTPDAGDGNWETNSATDAIVSTSGAAQVSTTSDERLQLSFRSSGSDFTSGTFYYGFDFTISAAGTISTNNSIRAVTGFRDGTVNSGTNSLSFGAFRPTSGAKTNSSVTDTDTDQVAVGLFVGDSQNASTTTLISWATALSRGTEYRAVLELDLDSNDASLWIDPSSSGSTSVTLSGLSTPEARGIFLNGGESSHGDWSIDNLEVSQDFNTAANISAVPEPSSFAFLVGLGALGMVASRRRGRRSLVA